MTKLPAALAAMAMLAAPPVQVRPWGAAPQSSIPKAERARRKAKKKAAKASKRRNRP